MHKKVYLKPANTFWTLTSGNRAQAVMSNKTSIQTDKNGHDAPQDYLNVQSTQYVQTSPAASKRLPQNAVPVQDRIAVNAPVTRGNLSARDLVMIEFQRASLEITKKFLESQQNVMLTYLNQAPQSAASAYSAASKLSNPRTDLCIGNEAEFVQAEILPTRYLIDQTQQTQEIEFEDKHNGRHNNIEENGRNRQNEPAPSSIVPVANAGTPIQMQNQIGPAAGVLDPEALITALIDIVSQRTGYPPEMLEPSLDLEADLGIDSIKRVEILNSFRKLLPEENQTMLEDGIEKLAGVKTLQGIMDWIRNDLNAETSADSSEVESKEAVV